MSTRVTALFGVAALAAALRARRLLDGRRRRARRWRSIRRCIYARNCARCHGVDGRGDPEIKKTMPNVRDFHDPAFRARAHHRRDRQRRDGRQGADARVRRSSLSLPKMQALSGYVRRLGAASAPPGAAP